MNDLMTEHMQGLDLGCRSRSVEAQFASLALSDLLAKARHLVDVPRS